MITLNFSDFNMDGRGRLLVDMVINKDQTSNSISETDETKVITPEMNNSHSITPVSSPCREIPDNDPVVMKDLMKELDDSEDNTTKGQCGSQTVAQNSPITETSWSLSNSVLTNYIDQGIDDIPSHISSMPPSVLSEIIQSDAANSSPGDMLLMVGSVSNFHNQKDFSPASGNDPNYTPSPLNASLFSSSSQGEVPPPNIAKPPEVYLDEFTGIMHSTRDDIRADSEDSQVTQMTKTGSLQLGTGRPRRGRKRKHPHLNREMNRINRNSNKTYFDYKDNEKRPREFTNESCICSNKCHEKISSDIRRSEFKRFWDLASYDAQNAYIAAKVIQKPTKSVIRNKSQTISENELIPKSRAKNFSRSYHITGVNIVCKSYFLETYQISSCRVNTALKKVNSNRSLKCQRGLKQGGQNKTPEDKRKEIIEFIKRIPTYESHYCRKETNALFFPPNLTLSKLIEMYREEFKENKVSDSLFKHIFYTEFNIRTATLKKDTCNFCDKINAQIVNERNETKKEELKKIHNEHLLKAEEAQRLLQLDIKYAQDNEDTECITFDMQKTLPLPRIPTNVVFYKRQLWLYNEGVYSGKNNQGYCYVWVEGEAGKGAQEVGSVLRKHVKEELLRDVKKIIFWSDSCGGQNRNIKITLILKTLFEELPNLQQITMKFLYSGHSFLPNDRHFATIESALKHQQRLYIPDDYINIMRSSKKKNPLIVKKMEKPDFISTETLEKHITNRKMDVNKDKISWLNTHEIKFNRSEQYHINIKDSFSDGEEGKIIDITRHKSKQENFSELLTPLWPAGKPIALPKLKDLSSLLPLIPTDCQEFYLNLHSAPDVNEDVEGYNVQELDFDIETE